MGYAFRGFNTHGRALFTLAHRAMAGRDEDDYIITDGERICSTAIGWNFGDGHMHNEQLIAAMQQRCHFEPGEVRVVLLDAQPIHGRRRSTGSSTRPRASSSVASPCRGHGHPPAVGRRRSRRTGLGPVTVDRHARVTAKARGRPSAARQRLGDRDVAVVEVDGSADRRIVRQRGGYDERDVGARDFALCLADLDAAGCRAREVSRPGPSTVQSRSLARRCASAAALASA